MTTLIMTFAIGLTRWWVRLYTRGLPPEMRDARRAEIESDLWEQGEDATTNGSQPDETALQVFGRLLLGIQADLSWRLEQRGAGRRSKVRRGIIESGGKMTTKMAGLGFILMTALLVGFYATMGVYVVFDEDQGPILSGVLTALFFAEGGMILAGLRLSRRAPLLGSVLLTVGALPLGLFVFWMVIPPVVAVLVTVFGVRRAIRFARERDRIATA
jgi:hypothetical protein